MVFGFNELSAIHTKRCTKTRAGTLHQTSAVLIYQQYVTKPVWLRDTDRSFSDIAVRGARCTFG